IGDIELYCNSLMDYNLTTDRYFALSSNQNNNEVVGTITMLEDKVDWHEAASFLARLFPNIKELIVTFTEEFKIDLSSLLFQWSGSLTSLTLFDLPSVGYVHQYLLPAICALPSLKRL